MLLVILVELSKESMLVWKILMILPVHSGMKMMGFAFMLGRRDLLHTWPSNEREREMSAHMQRVGGRKLKSIIPTLCQNSRENPGMFERILRNAISFNRDVTNIELAENLMQCETCMDAWTLIDINKEYPVNSKHANCSTEVGVLFIDQLEYSHFTATIADALKCISIHFQQSVCFKNQ